MNDEDGMEKLTLGHEGTQSADVVGENLEALRALYPEAWVEGKLDFDVLRQLLGGALDEREEKYGLNWHGKRRARQLALTPSTGTLRPTPDESVDWSTTQNLMIEGDNLEVLKLLQKSYAGKVKLIYIDPPYNTGKDFVYPDDFRDNIRNYLELTGQVEGGKKITSNPESSGRFHTDWLNMMYPRLKLARALLREDGVLFASIDDTELDNLRLMCAELFGEENFIVQIIWRKRSTPPNDKFVGANHDYILAYARDLDAVKLNLRERSEERLASYKNPDNHPKGPWVAGDLQANVKGGRYVASLNYAIINPRTGQQHFPSDNGNWRFSSERMAELLANDEIYFGSGGDGRPKLKRFLCDVKEGSTYPSIWDFVPLNNAGSAEMQELLGKSTVFENPKPVGLVQEMVRLGSDDDSIVLDFFAGSGSLWHAVAAENARDGASRRAICVQLPEPTDPTSDARASGYATIADLTKERLRRAAMKIRDENPLFAGDLGFRVFKLDSSNIRAWEPRRDELEQTLLESEEHIKSGRTEQDVLYELLLKLGLELTVPIETHTIAGKAVHSVGGGVLMVCLAEQVATADVEPLALGIVAWHEELEPAGEVNLVFRDSAFVDDVAKSNLTAILEQHGLGRVRSV